MEQYTFTKIGTIQSCYKEKFGIPRQPALVSSSASIEMEEDYSEDAAFRYLEQFSHIWVIFLFHGIEKRKWQPTVRPPRLGGNQRVGVFASRSMFRPNPVGLSVVELKNIERKNKKIVLNVIGGDFLDGTPVLDIKPYISYSDSIASADSGYAEVKPEIKLSVMFSKNATRQIDEQQIKYPRLKSLIIEVLQLDPHPAYKNKNKNEFAMKLYEFDLKWVVDGEQIVVNSLIVLE